jgi:lactate dehydrogenase-like 2-hydroxyacid dehydrogenase
VTVVNFMLTLASRMFAKDRLTRMGADGWAARSQSAHPPLSCIPQRVGSINVCQPPVLTLLVTCRRYMGIGVTGRTLGLIGMGNIGAEICRLVEPFDIQVVAFDPYLNREPCTPGYRLFISFMYVSPCFHAHALQRQWRTLLM